MSEQSLISVIVPVYNVERSLDRCVRSITEQTYRHLEIILVDDGSPDECPRMCDEWAGQDDRIRVVHKPNGGLSDARNAGLNVMHGDFVAFVDSDDYVEPDYVDSLYVASLMPTCLCAPSSARTPLESCGREVNRLRRSGPLYLLRNICAMPYWIGGW